MTEKDLGEMTKAELRAKYLEVREGIIDREAKDRVIFERVIRDTAVAEAEMVLLYASYRGEVDTWRLIEYFLGSGKKVALPRVEGKNLIFYAINDVNELEKGKFGILEPKGGEVSVFGSKSGKFGVLEVGNGQKQAQYAKTVCLVPGVCFNRQGYRVGCGAGFYDRFLSKNKLCSIGLCHQECLTEVEFQEIFDQKVDKVITD